MRKFTRLDRRSWLLHERGARGGDLPGSLLLKVWRYGCGMARPAQPFGRRNAAPARSLPSAAVASTYPTIPPAPLGESDFEERAGEHGMAVPRSFRAALLAGLAVGFCLVGLDIGHAGAVDPTLEPLFRQVGADPRQALPYTITFGLLTGARAAAATLLVAHRLLAGARLTGFAAYAGGGALVAAAWTLLAQALGHAPRHGWFLDLLAGAAAGALYRLFAGARPA